MFFRVPMFGYALLSFLLIAVVVAVALFFAFQSGEPGRTKLSGLAGCWIALALLVVAFVGATGLVAVCIANVPGELVKRGPVKSFELQWDDDHRHGHAHDGAAGDDATGAAQSLERDDTSRPKLVIELKDAAAATAVVRWIRENVEGDLSISSEELEHDDGTKGARITLWVDLSSGERADLARAKRDLEESLPGLKVPDGVKIELRDEDE